VLIQYLSGPASLDDFIEFGPKVDAKIVQSLLGPETDIPGILVKVIRWAFGGIKLFQARRLGLMKPE
jgi:hypothetical protein